MSSDRTPVNRLRAVTAAVVLADADGLDALSMRALAARLDVVPMALYKHVANKDDLVAAMVDSVVASYAATPGDGAWHDRARARILAARAALVRHPWLRRAIETRSVRTPAVLAHMDAVAGELLDGGLSVDLTHHAMHALGHRIWGFSPEAFDEPHVGPPPTAAELEVAGRTYPHIVAITTATLARGGACDSDYEFTFTLDLMLEAFAALHASGWSSPGDTVSP